MNNFEFVSSINISSLKKTVKKYSTVKWNNYDYRQKTFPVHKKTRTIPLIFNSDLTNIENPQEFEDFKYFSNEMLDIYNVLKSYYKTGSILKAILVKLLPNSKIIKHIDSGKSLENTKRHHIPIITNNKVLFTVGDETLHMKEGEIWQINNTGKEHSVENNSKFNRVHLIIDWLI